MDLVLKGFQKQNIFQFLRTFSIPIGIMMIDSVCFVANRANLNSPSLRTNFFPYLLIFPSGKTTSCSLFFIRLTAYLNAEKDGDN